jgi:hypothetical protein
MSTDYYLACHTHQEKIHVAQDGFSGWGFYSGEPHCMTALKGFLDRHRSPCHLELIPEQTYDYFHEIEWPVMRAEPQSAEQKPRAQSAADIQLHGCRQHGRRDCKTC